VPTSQRATAWHSTRVSSREVEGRPSPTTSPPPRHGRRSWPRAGIPYSRVDLGTVGAGIELQKAGSLPTDVETSASGYLLCEHADADSQRASNRSALPSPGRQVGHRRTDREHPLACARVAILDRARLPVMGYLPSSVNQ